MLEDLLGTWPELRVNIDPKHDAAVEPLIEPLRRCDAVDRVCVGAFSDERIATVARRAAGHLHLARAGRLAAARPGRPPGAPGRRAPGAVRPAAAHLRRHRVVTAEVVAEAHRRGMQVHVWTIDEPDEMRRLLDLGVDGLMTDRPAVLKDVLLERGAWFSV